MRKCGKNYTLYIYKLLVFQDQAIRGVSNHWYEWHIYMHKKYFHVFKHEKITYYKYV